MPTTYGDLTYGADTYGGLLPLGSIKVREVPPLRSSTLITTPNGRPYRWGEDEPRSENIPGPPQYGDSMPGGFTDYTQALPRKPGTDYSDLERLSTIQVIGPGGDIAWEGRLEKAPRTSGDQMAISPAAVGWQAALDDDQSVVVVIIDADLGNWGDPSAQRKVNLQALGWKATDVSKAVGGQDVGAAAPGITFEFSRLIGSIVESDEAWYHGGGADLGRLRYDFTGPAVDANWFDQAHLLTDDIASSYDSGTDHNAASVSNQTLAATVAGRKYAVIISGYDGPATGDYNVLHSWRNIRVIGNHGLTERGTWPAIGFYASDVIAYVLRAFAPNLNFTEGADGTIQSSSLVLPQLAFREPTTVAEIIKQANKPHLKDWAVWEDQTFYYHDRGARGRSWRARIGPSQLEETGADTSRLFNGCVVRFSDTDGSSKSVGPPGSNANVTDTVLLDTDEQNPANQLGIRRWAMLDMGIVSTTAVATEVGRRFLEETKLLDSSGQATIVGYCEDDHGIKRPYWQLRSGDTISFVDASDTSERRIVRTQKDHGTRTCSIDLDAPPAGMDALLERLGADLVPLAL